MELERIREAAERVARSAGMDLVDVEWKVGKQRFLRVYIDKPEGISHKDCEAVSNQFSVILDVEDLVPGPHYILEVSSPGLDRKLTKPAEFQRFAGRLARISTAEPVENQKFFEGRLAGFADGREAKAGIGAWFVFYNSARPHQALGYRTPMAVWRQGTTGALGNMAVDMTLRLDNARALPTYPPPPQQQKLLSTR